MSALRILPQEGGALPTVFFFKPNAKPIYT